MPVVNYHTVNGQMVGQSTGTTFTQYLTDALGSVTATVNGKRVTNTYRYKPYGERLAKTGVGPDPNFQWTGDTGSRVTGRTWAEQYNQARHYGARQASWTSVDPIWPMSKSHIYVEGNPTSMTDPTGLIASSCNSPRTEDCAPPPTLVNLCCLYRWKCLQDESSATFTMALRQQSDQIFGTFKVNIVYLGIPDAPYLCKERRETRTLTLLSTSGQRRFQGPRSWEVKNKGPIPPSSTLKGEGWSIELKCVHPGNAAFTAPPEGFKFLIKPDWVPVDGVPEGRDLFRVHPDGGGVGSAGCIVGRHLDAQWSKRVRSCFGHAYDNGCSKIKLKVYYT
ncbi:hypothetical protein CCB81_02510 [Armatimonadetes bacterium Uphvl-Ar2]|nr:hypothetical protein CCB81_02510 [Armatimonadetes bacterium Uphvl-Ar2]